MEKGGLYQLINIEFDWDQYNKNKNNAKHNVTYIEAEEIFHYKKKIIIEDRKHSDQEIRYITYGITAFGRLLAVIYTLRKGKIRIISARPQSRKERRQYEKKD